MGFRGSWAFFSSHDGQKSTSSGKCNCGSHNKMSGTTKETIVCACSKYLRDKLKIVLWTRDAVLRGAEFDTSTLKRKDFAQSWEKVSANALVNRVRHAEERKPCMGALFSFLPDKNGNYFFVLITIKMAVVRTEKIAGGFCCVCCLQRIIQARLKLIPKEVCFRVSWTYIWLLWYKFSSNYLSHRYWVN